MTLHWKTALAAASTALGLLACGGGGGGISGTGVSSSGTLHLSLTDAPACGYDTVYLTIDRIRVNKSDTAADGDSTWSEVVLSPAKRINLLNLTNGVLEELGQTPLPAGKYTQMRLVLAANTGLNPMANSVKPTNATEVALTTPSAQQSGLKLNVNMDIAADKTADFVIDFDACKSIVKRGNSGQYNLKPVMTVIPVLSSAGMRVEGFVEPAVAQPTTTVSLQLNGVPVKATIPDTNGHFVLSPVPVGSYVLVVTAPGHVTGVVTGVPVLATAVTTLNTTDTAIATPLATQRTVTGTLDPSSATVRALQSLTAGPSVEVAWGLVDVLPVPASFSLTLPMEAPVKAAYAALPALLNFAADNTASAKYTLEATSGASIKTQAIDVSTSVAPVAFVFP
jgi:hypothetical protein